MYENANTNVVRIQYSQTYDNLIFSTKGLLDRLEQDLIYDLSSDIAKNKSQETLINKILKFNYILRMAFQNILFVANLLDKKLSQILVQWGSLNQKSTHGLFKQFESYFKLFGQNINKEQKVQIKNQGVKDKRRGFIVEHLEQMNISNAAQIKELGKFIFSNNSKQVQIQLDDQKKLIDYHIEKQKKDKKDHFSDKSQQMSDFQQFKAIQNQIFLDQTIDVSKITDPIMLLGINKILIEKIQEENENSQFSLKAIFNKINIVEGQRANTEEISGVLHKLLISFYQKIEILDSVKNERILETQVKEGQIHKILIELLELACQKQLDLYKIQLK